MSSLKERMKVLPSIEVEKLGQFVLKINDTPIELFIQVQSIEYQIATGKSEVTIIMINPDPIKEESQPVTIIQGSNCYDLDAPSFY